MFRDEDALRLILYTVQKSEKCYIKYDIYSQINLKASN